MKSIFKILLAVLLVGIFAVPATQTVGSIMAFSLQNEFLYLIAGLDDAAENTDALLLVSYNSSDNTASVIQIPRDTYCDYGGSQNKINGLYPFYKSSGLTPDKAMEKTADFIADNFGLEIDGYLALTTDAFIDAVDAIGGVTVVLPYDFVYNDKNPNNSFVLNKGENVLNGRQAEIFVRHRKSYITGDLGRLDAQKIFIDGLYNTVTKKIEYDALFDALGSIRKGLITDFSAIDFVVMILKHSSKFRDTEITYLTMPGEAVKDTDGIWYYVLNKNSVNTVISEHLFSVGDFDEKRVFTNNEKPLFLDIYNRHSVPWKEYGSNSIKDINIPKRKS
jgi:LCP family protein required for cell wall assembly